MTADAQKKEAATASVTLVRLFDAPRSLVFRAWTDPELMANWWGPKGFTNPRCELDVRPGGKIHIDMRAPNGIVYPMTGTFHEVVQPERLVFTAVAEDRDGDALMEERVTVTFEDQAGKTRMTVQADAVGLAPVASKLLEGMEPGWSQSLVRLGALVSGGR